MFKHILIATDGSDLANKAVAAAITLGRNTGAMLTSLMVVPDYGATEYAAAVVRDGISAEALRHRVADAGLEKLEATLQHLGAADYEMERQIVVDDTPHEQIFKQAQRLHCDLIVVASRGHGAVKSALLGSQTLAVLAGSPVPVLVIK